MRKKWLLAFGFWLLAFGFWLGYRQLYLGTKTPLVLFGPAWLIQISVISVNQR
jgi:hypothetical protein